MKIRPQHRAVDPVGRVEHVVMIAPVNAQEDEAQQIAEERRHHVA
jgi:hypothetical protein